MMPKIINILETVGALLIVAAFTLWSGEWWQLSNKLWWAALLIITPVIIWKNRSKPASEKVLVAILFCCLLAISRVWFGKKDINVKIPYLPKITINR